MNIVITGSSTGIGRALTERLLLRGHRVWGLARSNQATFAAQYGGNFCSSQCDVANWTDIARAAAEVSDKWAHIDCLVTCAGIQGEIVRAVASNPDKWSATIRANLDGTYFTIRAFDSLLAKAPRRAKVVCFSGGGSTKPRPNFSAYGVAKTGVVRLVETIATEEGSRAFDINAIAPGAINTRLTDEILAVGAGVAGESEFSAAQKQKAAGNAPLENALDCVEWLISPDSDGISGRLISATWDRWSELPQHKGKLADCDIFTLRRIVPSDRSESWENEAQPPDLTAKRLKVAVVGLWHLGSVTAAGAAQHFDVVGLEFNKETVRQLSQGRAPLFEPGLNELITARIAAKSLRFTTDALSACANVDVLWFTCDTPVDENDDSNVAATVEQLVRCVPHLVPGTLVVISSQLPVGTCRQLEQRFPHISFACSPENLRLGRALETFNHPERVIIGIRDDSHRELLKKLFTPFSKQLIFMRTESAEMLKHSLNSFLALSISFINEIARLSEHVGADAREVAAGLKSEARIGPGAYLLPGGPFAGGTLARDVVSLVQLGRDKCEELSVIPAIKRSNDHHRGWALRRLRTLVTPLHGKVVAILGLTYKPHTDTLHRSAALELSVQLGTHGARVCAFDPVIHELPQHLRAITLCHSLSEAIVSADAVVICTEWPEFRAALWQPLVTERSKPLIVIDANRYLEKQLNNVAGVTYVTVGRPL